MLVSNRNEDVRKLEVKNSFTGYNFIEKINQGTFGIVTLYEKNGKKYAVKEFTNKKMGILHLTTSRELQALIKLSECRYVISVEEIVLLPEEILVVFPFCKESLTGKKYLKMKDLKEHFKQIVTAVKEMHDMNFIHRDLKSSNIMVGEDDNVQIIDFGMARQEQPMMTSLVTTLWYRAPELLEYGNKNVYTKYDNKIDIWSIGIIFLEMLLGYPPCKTNCEIEQLKIYKRDLSDINKRYYYLDDDAKDLLRGMLQLEPEKRFSSDEILSHQFFKNINNDPMKYFTENDK